MILYVDLANGEVREPALGVVGRIMGLRESEVHKHALALVSDLMGPITVELDTKKVEIRIEELQRPGGMF